MILQMERTYFRALTTQDEAALLEIYSDKEAMQYRASLPFETLADVRAFLDQVEREQTTGKKYRFAYVHLQTNELMGTGVYTFLDDESVEIGFSIGRSFWKGGYGTEGTRGLIELIKQREPQIKRIIGIAKTANEKSVRMMERMNFTFIKQEADKSYFEYLL
ncbi:GNAT family N-acetyltransferase [Myroides sp. NP-2]|uniref:GNAT family N-acetyltransferase n=1 Tax=Myroides sp. NP-2 TaxID=2759945 RepID=UPI0015F9B45A|nr:GNAT family N-acetyltransferase [Myroides sp. NP-2]MBB1148980.1 GNAT family N-acetyltransferase [Myroides sp. NP-2]